MSDTERDEPAAAVDWRLAARTAEKLVRPGPAMSIYTREQVSAELAELSVFADAPVREVTLLADDSPVTPATIVDRPGWARAAAESLADLTGTAMDKPAGLLRGRPAGLQAGAVLGFLSTAIIGQYDPFTGPDGTLLLVAPNVVATERAMRVNTRDFRMWVCLHEVTHRVQFTSSPWLAKYMRGLVDTLGEHSDENLSEVVGRLAAAVRRSRGADQSRSDLGLERGMVGALLATQPPKQRNAMVSLLMLGTLLEGHAEHVMDAAGPAVVPSVAHIRSLFDERRRRRNNPIQWLMRTLLGVDAKIAQYIKGKEFVDEVVSRVGMREFNAIWSEPAALPQPGEIGAPGEWIKRVLG
ncbi:zinc-dependent metalloprotease [Hoyosella subflava]|uniref:Hydrolase n=1 Tax=Hoyosella subflava (strain DSM 45089 / JCM 17490 / NBRC 109087 / DQS3-9A1) TaxID=443218 RepID=F6EG65_HOYSD|nr:zinc-dependent metalloprotease [Hoyosella subflava]AEF38767.1 hypothetical protein AS9A_0308 [Hoyosella subflava DQS3-9A1]